MLLNDIKFELYLFDRFFRIIADAKQLLNMNSDSGFVLILTLSKMMEAVSVKTLDEVITKAEKLEVTQPIANITETVTKPQEIEQPPIDKDEEKIDIVETDNNQSIKAKDEIIVEDENQIKYKKLIDIIYDKSYDLGECFEKSFAFSSYENNTLKINSSAQGECKTKLYKNFAHIKMFVSEVYGEETQLDFAKIQKENNKDTARTIKATIAQPENISQEDTFEQPSSCMASMTAVKNPNLSQKDLNIDDVLNSKMTSTALKLFQSPNSPRIKSKL